MSRSADDVSAARPIALEEVPLVDFAPFLTGDADARLAVANEIARACEEIGFFYLKGHGVPDAITQDIFSAATAFFARPRAERAQSAATPAWYRGWIGAPEANGFSRNTRLFDQYRLQHVWPADPEDMDHAAIFDHPNRFPADMPEFQRASEAYLQAMEDLSRELLRAFALGLGLAEDRFDACFQHPASQLSMNYYPRLPHVADDDVSNMVPHTDEGPFTILAQSEIGGLEVKRRDGAWIKAPPMPGAYTINVGDMMMWWSNGRFLSNLHRVRNRAGEERLSVPYFANPDRSVIVGPLPELAGDAPLYPPVKVADHLARFYATLAKNPHDIYG